MLNAESILSVAMELKQNTKRIEIRLRPLKKSGGKLRYVMKIGDTKWLSLEIAFIAIIVTIITAI